MNTLQRRTSRLPRIPLAVLGLTIAVVVGGRVIGPVVAPVVTPVVAPQAAAVSDDGDGATGNDQPGLANPLDPAAVSTTDDDLARIRANITFWDDRFRGEPPRLRERHPARCILDRAGARDR